MGDEAVRRSSWKAELPLGRWSIFRSRRRQRSDHHRRYAGRLETGTAAQASDWWSPENLAVEGGAPWKVREVDREVDVEAMKMQAPNPLNKEVQPIKDEVSHQREGLGGTWIGRDVSRFQGVF